MATLISVTGETTEVRPASGKRFSLQELQAMVGGYIQLVSLADGRAMFINEEGKLQRLPRNFAATLLCRVTDEDGYPAIFANDEIVGPAVVLTLDETRADMDMDVEEEE